MNKLLCLLLILVMLLSLSACGGENPVVEDDPDDENQGETEEETTEQPDMALLSGYYLLYGVEMDGEVVTQDAVSQMQSYVLIRDDQTGVIMMYEEQEFHWDDSAITINGEPYIYELTDDLLTLSFGGDLEGFSIIYQYHGDELPEDYGKTLTSGYFALSSVGVNGNVSFYNTANPENGYVRLKEDGTGTLYYEDTERTFTWDASCLYFEDDTAYYMYYNEAMTGDEEMLLIYFESSDTSLIFRPVAEETP